VRGSPHLVSVIVPARNAARTLTQQLDAISRQDYRGSFELIIATNGGRDGTADVAARWALACGMGTVVDASARRGAGYARNRGAASAGGDFLAFCDADDVVSRGWLRALTDAAEVADVVTGPQATDLLNEEPARSSHSLPPAGRPMHGFLPIASGSNCGVWRDVFDALGGFDEQCATGEDAAFSWRAQLGGFRLRVTEDAVVQKRLRPTRLAIGRRYFSYGIGDAWLYSRFRSAGMPRRDVGEALREWLAVASGRPAPAGTPSRWGRVLRTAALACGRVTGSIRYRALFL
jgi:glycosyltransferase involved in cell wall biosynthesis